MLGRPEKSGLTFVAENVYTICLRSRMSTAVSIPDFTINSVMFHLCINLVAK